MNLYLITTSKWLYRSNFFDGITFIEKQFKLTTNKSLMNLHLYNSDNQIQKFKDVYAIMEHHFNVRYALY